MRNECGAAAVEFALIMVPLLGLVLMAVQTGIVFFADQALQTATKAASRQLMTGAAQTSGLTQTGFITSVCTLAPAIPNCKTSLYADVESASTFSGLPTTFSPTYNPSHQISNTQFTPGNAGDIVIVRVMYNWPIFGGPIAAPLVNAPNSTRLIEGVVVFKNEPYS